MRYLHIMLFLCMVASAGAFNLAEGITANLSIWDTTDYVQVDNGEIIDFFANFTNGTDAINGTDVFCLFTTDANGSWSEPVNMTFNISSGLYELEASISRAGNHTFNVTCDGSAQFYDILSASDNVDIKMSVITLCQAGCDYSDITSALSAAEAAASRIVINGSGEYIADSLAYSLNATILAAISIESDDITIDCNRSSLTGNSSGYAIYMNGYSNITVTDCIISNYSKAILARYTDSGIFSNLNISSSAHAIHLATANTGCLIDNSTFSGNSIALQLDTTNSTIIKDTLISGSTDRAIRFESSNFNLVKDTTITGSAITDVYTIQDSNNTLLNVTFSSAEILEGSGWLYVSYYVDAQVNDSDGSPVEGMTVRLNDTAGEVFSVTTSSSGLTAKQNVTSYYRNNETLFNLSPFVAIAYNATHSSNASSFSLDSSMALQIAIDTTAPAISSVSNSSITNQSVLISWSTDDDANAALDYGTTLAFGDSVSNTSWAASHAFSLSGLLNSTLYYYNITSCNRNSYCVVAGPYSFTTQDAPDGTPPVISGLLNTTTNQSAEIAFTTDDSANSTIEYGTTVAFGSSVYNTSFLSSHSVNLSGLQNNTLYYFNITVCNQDGYCSVYGTYNLTTEQSIDMTPPVISAVQNSSITNISAVISWTTDDLSNSSVRYGTTTAVLSSTSNSSLATSHSIILTGLLNSTLYYYNLTSCNQDGYCASSAQYSFTTLPSYDTVPPSISSVANTSVTGSSALITWTTDEPANSTVKYGTSTGAYPDSEGSGSYVTSHSISLSGLDSETVYYYVVNSSDYSNNSAQSAEFSFTTPDITPPAISSVTNITGESFAVISWSTDEPAQTLVKYGIVSGSYVYSYSNSTLVTSHTANLTGLSTGTYYYAVNSTDAANNSNQSAQYSFGILDERPPGVAISSPANGSTVSDWANIGLTVVTSEVAVCTLSSYRLGASTASPSSVMNTTDNLTHNLLFNATADSSGYDNYFQVSCSDASTNSNSSVSYFRLNDTTAPSFTFYTPTPPDTGYISSPNVTVNFTLSEAASSSFPKLSFNGGTNETVTASSGFYIYLKTSQDDGSYNFSVYAQDAKGNTANVTRAFGIDTEEPSMTVESPSRDQVYGDCRDLAFNVTVSEQAECGFVLYGDSKDSHTLCVEECKSERRSCLADAEDDADEEDCEEVYDDCADDCIEDRYSLIDSGEMEESGAYDACRDVCKDSDEACDDKCESDKETCLLDSETSADRADCASEFDSCSDDCAEEYEGCDDDCESGDWYYVYAYPDCLEQGLYIVELQCEDFAGNLADRNVSFSMLDALPPRIIDLLPAGEIGSDSATLKITTDESADCRASLEDKPFEDMEISLASASTLHTYQLSGLKDGTYTYYILCNDTAGNLMASPEKAVFTVKLAGPDPPAQTSGTFTVAELPKDASQEFEITGISSPVLSVRLTVTETLRNAGIKVIRISDTSNIKKPDNVAFDYFEITRENIPADKLKEAVVKFKVQKSWMDANRIDNSKVSLLRYTTQWDRLETAFQSSDSAGFVYEAKTPGFSVFAIEGEQLPLAEDKAIEPNEEGAAEIEDSSSWLWILIACVVVVGGGSAYYYVVSHRHPQQDSYAESQIRQAQSSVAAAGQPAVALRDSVDEYIMGCHQAGMSVDDIRSSLVGAGHLDEDIGPRFVYLGLLYDAAADAEVLQYVRDSIAGGMAQESIRAELLKVGHPEDEINRVFQAVSGPQAADAPIAQEDEAPSTGDEILDYIIAALKAGISREEIEMNLVSAGFGQREVERKLLELDSAQAPPEERTELDEYIGLSLSKGMAPEDIKRSLLQLGLSDAEVDAAMQRFAG